MTVRVMEGDVLDVLRSLPANTFQCAATSPPYYGLRDYGLPPQVWGGEPGHEHTWSVVVKPAANGIVNSAMQGETLNGTSGTRKPSTSGLCACGAWLGSLGLEPEPSLYVEHLVSVFREVRRVLRPDGVCWVNLGDSYAGSGKGPSNSLQPEASQIGKRNGAQFANGQAPTSWLPVPSGYKPKDLLGMPWMVAFALRADGWYLRGEIIWSKPNPMPESVTDRPTKAHETVFLLSKQRTYFYDSGAIKEEGAEPDRVRLDRIGGANGHSVRHSPGALVGPSPTRNKRSVWEIATAPFPSAHFATFPPKLVEPMLLAGSRPGDHVLDPFGGAGTTGLVADRLGRDCTLIELNPAYASMARERIASDAPLFVDVA